MKYFLAIDIGASSGRHLLGWIENGKLVTEEIYRFGNLPKNETVNGRDTLLWDTERLFTEIVNGLKACAKDGRIPYSVAIDTWGVDYALLDKDDKLISEVYCYRDSRTELTIPKVHGIIPFAELYAKTGIQFNTFNSIYQLYDDKESGKMDKAETFLMLPSYFAYRLSGVKKQEYTNATTTGMINAAKNEWDYEIIERLGFKKELFKPLTDPSELIGEFSDEIAKEVGFKAKMIMPATHDTASAVIGAPLEANAPYISSGTWSLLGVEEKVAHTDEAAMNADYSNEGGPNGTYRLQKNIMGLWMIQQVRHETGDAYSFGELADMARESVCDYIIDVADNRFLAPKNMTEEIKSAVGKELTLGETAFVIYNSLAKFYATSLDALEGVTGIHYDTLNIIGGGSQNTLLNELTATYTKKRIITGPTECTAIGNLIMQMVGAGEVESVAEGRKIIKNSFEIKEI